MWASPPSTPLRWSLRTCPASHAHPWYSRGRCGLPSRGQVFFSINDMGRNSLLLQGIPVWSLLWAIVSIYRQIAAVQSDVLRGPLQQNPVRLGTADPQYPGLGGWVLLGRWVLL